MKYIFVLCLLLLQANSFAGVIGDYEIQHFPVESGITIKSLVVPPYVSEVVLANNDWFRASLMVPPADNFRTLSEWCTKVKSVSPSVNGYALDLTLETRSQNTVVLRVVKLAKGFLETLTVAQFVKTLGEKGIVVELPTSEVWVP